MGDNQGSQSEEDFDEVLEINEAIAQLGITGIPLAKSLGLTEKDLSFMLTVARKYFAAKDYGAAASLYLLLVVLDHSRAGTWVNLGIAEHLGGKLNRALNAFALATWEAPEDPVPSLHLADCYIECDRIDDAVRALSMAAESVGEDPNHKRLREQAEQLRKALVTKHAGKVKRGGNG